MFKSEKHNLIADIILGIAAIIIVYSVSSFEKNLWFNVLFPLLIFIRPIGIIYKMYKNKQGNNPKN